MKWFKKWFISKLTVVDIVEYFNGKDIMIYLRYIKKHPPTYYGKNSKLYKRDNK